MAVVRPRGSELTELVADHIFRDEHGNEFASVMDGKGQPNGFGNDGRASRPGLDDLFRLLVRGLVDLLEQMPVDEESFLDGAGHELSLLGPMLDDHAVGALVLSGLEAFAELAPG